MGYYKLGDSINQLSLESIDLALKVVLTAAALWALAVVLAEVIYRAAT